MLQGTLAVHPEQHADVASCSSSKKRKNTAVTNTAKDDHYLLLNFAVLKSIITDVGRCPKCTKCNYITYQVTFKTSGALPTNW